MLVLRPLRPGIVLRHLLRGEEAGIEGGAIVRIVDDPLLRALPPEPHGGEWIIDSKTGQIVSSYYGMRWELHAPDAAERKAMYGWARETEAPPQKEEPDGKGGTSR